MDESSMTLGKDWAGQCVDGWFVTEKLDGIRAYWNGKQFWTRGGNVIAAPDWFTAGLPDGLALDGEIWAGRGNLQTARLAVQHARWTPTVRFVVFDCPAFIGDIAQRLKMACRHTSGLVGVVTVSRVANLRALRREFRRVLASGGEGLMLRNPATKTYEQGRTGNLLKVKSLVI